MIQNINNSLLNLFSAPSAQTKTESGLLGILGQKGAQTAPDELLSIAAERQGLVVNLGLETVSEKVGMDLAGEIATHLAGNPDLASDFAVAIFEDQDGALKARAYRVSALTEGLDEEQAGRVAEALNDNPVFKADEASLPAASQDKSLLNLASGVNEFLDSHQDLFALLERSGLPVVPSL